VKCLKLGYKQYHRIVRLCQCVQKRVARYQRHRPYPSPSNQRQTISQECLSLAPKPPNFLATRSRPSINNRQRRYSLVAGLGTNPAEAKSGLRAAGTRLGGLQLWDPPSSEAETRKVSDIDTSPFHCCWRNPRHSLTDFTSPYVHDLRLLLLLNICITRRADSGAPKPARIDVFAGLYELSVYAHPSRLPRPSTHTRTSRTWI
jgi:hypothetical protein